MAFALAITEHECPLTCMADSLKQTVLNSFRQLLRPLVRILLRHDVSFGEFEETTKMVFVEVARRDFLKDVSSSQAISKRTGLAADEVHRVEAVIENTAPPSNANLNRIGRLLGGWHQDPQFTGPYGLPLEISFQDEPNCFAELVRRYCPEISPEEMLRELIRVGVISELAGSKFRVLTRSYIPAQSDSAIVQFMGVALRDLAETLDCNLEEDEESGYFERRVWTPHGIDRRDMPHFDALVNAKGQEFLETLDNWLSSRESDAESLPDTEKLKVGVGVYLFSDAERQFRED